MNTPYIRKEILNLSGYRLKSYPDTIKLNQNEIPYDIPGELKAKVLEKLVRISWNRYPFSQPYTLRSKLAQALQWPEEGLLLTNGSNVLIQAILMASALKSRVLTLTPSFSLYEIEAEILGNKVDLVPLGENFSFPLEVLLQKIKKNPPQVIFIANPNAPTANLFPANEIIELVEQAPCLVVVDEAYFQFADTHLFSQLRHHKNLILLRTFSKALGLGAIRVGYAAGAPEIIQEISKVTLPYCVSGLNEILAESILEHPELVEKRVTEIKINRARLYQGLMNLTGVKTYPSQTNFIIFQVSDSKKVFEELVKEKVLVRDVSHSPDLENTLRVTVGTQEENARFLQALEKIVKKI